MLMTVEVYDKQWQMLCSDCDVNMLDLRHVWVDRIRIGESFLTVLFCFRKRDGNYVIGFNADGAAA
jgi:hypothetical protein